MEGGKEGGTEGVPLWWIEGIIEIDVWYCGGGREGKREARKEGRGGNCSFDRCLLVFCGFVCV